MPDCDDDEILDGSACVTRDGSTEDSSIADTGTEDATVDANVEHEDAQTQDAGFDANTSSVPLLHTLAIEGGLLVPAFDSNILEYRVRVQALNDTVTVAAEGAVGSAVSVSGVPATWTRMDDRWLSPPLPMGESSLRIRVTEADQPSREYSLQLIRGDVDFLKASEPSVDDRFGWRVAIDGDTMVVGASQEDASPSGGDNEELDSGAAYIFVQSDGVWRQQAVLKASNGESGDWFGYSVAISGDTVVVGANHEDSAIRGIRTGSIDANDNGETDSGAAYVFFRSNGTWAQQAFLKASNADARDWFGGQVAIDGDTIVVGAGGEDSSTKDAQVVPPDQGDNDVVDSGAAYVFVRNGSEWSEQAFLKAPNGETLDYFGEAIDVDGDTIVVGAPSEDSAATEGAGGGAVADDNGALGSGAAYVFLRNGATWVREAYLKAGNSGSGDAFGSAVSVDDDTIVIGAPGEDSDDRGARTFASAAIDDNALESGAAYVFKRIGVGAWEPEAHLKAPNSEANDAFGASVSLHAGSLAIGAAYEDGSLHGMFEMAPEPDDNESKDSGAVYVFTRLASDWTPTRYFKASRGSGGDRFGWRVSLTDAWIAISADNEGSAADGTIGALPSSGAAFVF